MSKNYDMIATVDIDLETPLVDNTSFSNLLIVGPLPKVTPKKAPPKVGAYSSIDEVVEAGWETSGDGADPVGVAAQVAFGQSPTPTTNLRWPDISETRMSTRSLMNVAQPACTLVISTDWKEPTSIRHCILEIVHGQKR